MKAVKHGTGERVLLGKTKSKSNTERPLAKFMDFDQREPTTRHNLVSFINQRESQYNLSTIPKFGSCLGHRLQVFFRVWKN